MNMTHFLSMRLSNFHLKPSKPVAITVSCGATELSKKAKTMHYNHS